MSKAVQDRRIVKTQQNLLEAMVALLGKRDWAEINVQQICDEANIARSTFYVHFNNKQELFDFGFDKLEQHLSGKCEGRGLDINATFSFLPELLEHIQQHQPIFCANHSCKNVSQSAKMVFGKFQSIIFKFTLAELKASPYKNSHDANDALFIAGGIYGILNNWWLDDTKVPIPNILAIIDAKSTAQLKRA